MLLVLYCLLGFSLYLCVSLAIGVYIGTWLELLTNDEAYEDYLTWRSEHGY